MEEATFVIVGGGIAGVSCAELLGVICPNEKVILLTAAPVVKAVTNVVPLTKMLAKFDVIEKAPDSFSDSLPSLKIIQDSVSSINSSEHTVTAQSGLIVKYKKLCICSGGIPKLISSDEFVVGIRDTESVQNFQSKIKSARRVVVVGNGGIATELVYELTGVEIVWIIKDNHFSAPFIDSGAAEFFWGKLIKDKEETSKEKHFRKRKIYKISNDGPKTLQGCLGAALGPDWHADLNLHGGLQFVKKNDKIIIEYDCEIGDIIKHDDDSNVDPCYKKDVDANWPVQVKLTNGKVYGCDVIVSATGVLPNSTFTMEDGKTFDLAKDGGINVNEYMKTNLKDVFAAGDVCTANWDHAHHWFQMRLWTQAHQMGCYAAKAMTAELMGVVLLGLFNGQKLDRNYSCQVRVTPGVEYIKLVMEKGKMQGAILIGDTDIEEMCENLILNQLNVADIENDLLNPDIDIEDYFD